MHPYLLINEKKSYMSHIIASLINYMISTTNLMFSSFYRHIFLKRYLLEDTNLWATLFDWKTFLSIGVTNLIWVLKQKSPDFQHFSTKSKQIENENQLQCQPANQPSCFLWTAWSQWKCSIVTYWNIEASLHF